MASEESPKRQIVLCFDGTGNTFRADGADTNILKIYRMLEKSDNTLSYYQPGIGTDITPGSLASTTLKHSSRLGKSKTISQALGRSFEQHVLGGYRFLMRHYRQDTELYIFGFSRGAYTACFLSEMLNSTGLLGPDNEEMIPFIWKAFSEWKLVRFNEQGEQNKKAFDFLRASRETLTRVVPRVKFLGVFDTVNSVAEFEVDNNFGNCAWTTRHAVSIDERRVKFQPVLLRKRRQREFPWVHRFHQHLARRVHHLPAKDPGPNNPELAHPTPETSHCIDSHNGTSFEGKSGPVWSPESRDGKTNNARDKEHTPDDAKIDELEVWFPGCHADVGGGNKPSDVTFQLSHAPLVWMVQEATKAGLRFDERQVEMHQCVNTPEDDTERREYLDALYRSSEIATLNDRLRSGGDVSVASALAWNILEYLPIKHVEIQKDGGSTTMHFPLHRGEPRGIPTDALVHVSAIRRMKHNEDYRPGNLIVGEGGRGVIKAPPEYGLGDWEPKYHIGDPVHELYMRKTAERT